MSVCACAGGRTRGVGGVGARVTGSGGGTRVEVVVGEVGLSGGRTGENRGLEAKLVAG